MRAEQEVLAPHRNTASEQSALLQEYHSLTNELLLNGRLSIRKRSRLEEVEAILDSMDTEELESRPDTLSSAIDRLALAVERLRQR